MGKESGEERGVESGTGEVQGVTQGGGRQRRAACDVEATAMATVGEEANSVTKGPSPRPERRISVNTTDTRQLHALRTPCARGARTPTIRRTQDSILRAERHRLDRPCITLRHRVIAAPAPSAGWHRDRRAVPALRAR